MAGGNWSVCSHGQSASTIFNRPRVAGAVLQTPSKLIDSCIKSVSQSVIPCEDIFTTPLFPNRKS